MAGFTPTRSINKDVRDYTWLASEDGTENTQSATLNYASLNAAGNHKLDNWLKSGTPLGIITQAGATQGQFGLYTPGATNGLQTHVFLIAEIQLQAPAEQGGDANSPITGAVLRRGQIIVNRLPVTFDPAGAGADKAHFVYR